MKKNMTRQNLKKNIYEQNKYKKKIYLKCILDKKHIYKFFKPVKYELVKKEIRKKSVLLSLKLKAKLIVRCLNCSYLFLKKIQTNSIITIYLKRYKKTYNTINFLYNGGVDNTIEIIKEEVFHALPILIKHNSCICKKSNT